MGVHKNPAREIGPPHAHATPLRKATALADAHPNPQNVRRKFRRKRAAVFRTATEPAKPFGLELSEPEIAYARRGRRCRLGGSKCRTVPQSLEGLGQTSLERVAS